MAVVVIRRTNGYTLDVDGHTTELRADQARALSDQLRDALSELSGTRTVTPAKWRKP